MSGKASAERFQGPAHKAVEANGAVARGEHAMPPKGRDEEHISRLEIDFLTAGHGLKARVSLKVHVEDVHVATHRAAVVLLVHVEVLWIHRGRAEVDALGALALHQEVVLIVAVKASEAAT